MNLFKKAISSFIPLRRLFASGGISLLFRVSGMGLNFMVTFLITNHFNESVFGNYSLAYTLAQATAMVFALGLPNSLISYLGINFIEDSFSQFLFRKGLRILLFIAVIPFLIYFFGAEIIAVRIFHKTELVPYIAIVSFTVPIMIIHEFILYFFIATKNFMKFNFFMFVAPNGLFLLLLLFIKNTQGYYTLLLFSLSTLTVLLVALFSAFRKTEKHDKPLSSKEIIRFASPMMFSTFMIFLLNWTDIFILGAMVPAKEIGIYNLAYKIASLSMLVIISMNVVLAPKISQLYTQEKMEELHKTVKATTHLIIGLTLPLVLGIILFSDFLLGLFGNSFSEGKMVLIIISIGFLINAFTGNVDQILNMTGHQKSLRNITIIGFVMNAALNLALIPFYGIIGSALASLITNVIFNVACLLWIKKKLNFYTFM